MRDNEWLHSLGDYEGIFQTIRWGVKKEDHRARTRAWDMRPRGGELLNTADMRAVAAYIWGQANGVFVGSDADVFVDRMFRHGMDEVTAERGSTRELPVDEARLVRVAFDIFDRDGPLEARKAFELGLRAYPESAGLLAGIGITHAVVGEADRAEEMLIRALDIDPEHEIALRWIERVRTSD